MDNLRKGGDVELAFASVPSIALIGDNIKSSRSPHLHRLAGQLCGHAVNYRRLIPAELGMDFDQIFADCAASGYRGINVTYPYKERVVEKVIMDDPLVRRIGAVNTVVFTPDGAKGYNTDYSGFQAAFRHLMGEKAAGKVCMIGAGGVGKAVAFGLLGLGLAELAIVERDIAKAQALGEALRDAAPGLAVSISGDAAEAAHRAQGLINCTPVGMIGYDGTPLPRALMQGATWAFDAVYTPVETQFLRDADAMGLQIISGYELFFFQGVHAWDIFVGASLDQFALRNALIEAKERDIAA